MKIVVNQPRAQVMRFTTSCPNSNIEYTNELSEVLAFVDKWVSIGAHPLIMSEYLRAAYKNHLALKA